MTESEKSSSAVAWMVAGALVFGLLVVGVIAGVDHGLHNDHFFGTGACARQVGGIGVAQPVADARAYLGAGEEEQ